MHIRHKRTLAAIAALSTAGAGLMALSTSPANALAGIDLTITSNNGASRHHQSPTVHGPYLIKNAAVGDVADVHRGRAPPRSRPSPRRTVRPAQPASRRPTGRRASPTPPVPSLGVIPASPRRTSPSRTTRCPARPANFGVSGGQSTRRRGRRPCRPSWRGRRRPPEHAVRGWPDPVRQPEPERHPTLTANDTTCGGTVTLGGTHFWGSPVIGAGTATAMAAGIPAPTILLDGAPIARPVPPASDRFGLDHGGRCQPDHRRPHPGWCPDRKRRPAEQPRGRHAHHHGDRGEHHAVRRQRSVEHVPATAGFTVDFERGRPRPPRPPRAGRHRGHHHRRQLGAGP